MAKGDPLKPFNLILEGTKLTNEDGVIREDIIKNCKVGEKLELFHNPKVSEAVKVYTKDGTLIGYIPPEAAVEIASRLKKGSPVNAEIAKISGGGFFRKSIACSVKITKYSER